MRRAFFTLSVVCALGAGWPAASVACGDKFLVVGRGVQRVSKARHPASILIFTRPDTEMSRAARDMRLEATLRRAGHAVDTVSDEAAMATTLATRRHDFVLVDAADAAAVGRSAPGERAQVVPVATRPSRETLRALEARHALVIRAGKGLAYLTKLDEAMRGRANVISSR